MKATLRDWWQRWKKTSLPNKLGIIISSVALVLTIINLRMLKRQIDDQDKQVAQITGAINNGITTAKGAIEGVLSQNRQATTTALTENREALNRSLAATHADNQASIKATLAQGREALDASIAASHLEQRPWLIVSRAILVQHQTFANLPLDSGTPIFEFSPGLSLAAQIEFTNIGKSPAHGTSIRLILKTFAYNGRQSDIEASAIAALPLVMLQQTVPNTVAPQRMTFRVTNPVGPFTPMQIDSIKRARAGILLVGKVTYSDSFGKPGETQVCTFWGKTDPTIRADSEYSDIR